MGLAVSSFHEDINISMRTIKPSQESLHCVPRALACGDFALVQLSDGTFIVGSAPFHHSFEPAPEGASFYVNDFALSDQKPWRIPSKWMEFNSLNDLVGDYSLPSPLSWIEPDLESFTRIFETVKTRLDKGQLVKAVPVVSSRCSIADNAPFAERLVRAALPGLRSASLCAFQSKGRGFTALTPERLLKIKDGQLETMALAGTATSEEGDSFLKDAKEQREHLLVVEVLRRSLSLLGEVIEHDREILDMGGMIHFLTRFSVRLSGSPRINDVIKALHPTPAVGVVPREPGLVEELYSQRAESAIPTSFGAPFGVKFGDCFESFVLIRGVFWEGKEAFLPSGCGIVQESVLQREWDELALKRNWVKEAFSLM